MDMGRENADDHNERFCLSIFACNTCQEVNGVGKRLFVVDEYRKFISASKSGK